MQMTQFPPSELPFPGANDGSLLGRNETWFGLARLGGKPICAGQGAVIILTSAFTDDDEYG